MAKDPKKKPKNKTPKKTGRQSKYDQMRISQKLDSIRGWARHGATLAEIAEMLEVAESTLYRWKGEKEEFREALRVGAREANGEILNSAFRQSTGYYALQREAHKCKKIAYRPNDKGIDEIVRDARGTPVLEDVVEVVEFEKFFEPDARMTMFMLNNRMSDAYKQKPEAEGDKETIVEHHLPEEEQESAENNPDRVHADSEAAALPHQPSG